MKIQMIIDEMIRIGKVIGYDGKQIMAKPWYSQDTVQRENGVLSTHTSWWFTGEGEVRGLWYDSNLNAFADGRVFTLIKQNNCVYIEHNGRLFAAAIRESRKYRQSYCYLVSCTRVEGGVFHFQALNREIDGPLLWIKENDGHCELERLAVACHGLFASHDLELAK